MSFEQDQLLLPFASLLAFQPVIANDSPAPDAVPQAAPLHRAGAVPRGIALPADCHWGRAWRLDQNRSLPQVRWWSEAAAVSFRGNVTALFLSSS